MSHVNDRHEATEIALVADLTQLRANEHDARYPNLLFGPWDQQAPAWQRMRSASGLHAVMIEQRALSEAQRRELGAFRLRQFVLCEWYDAQRVAADRLAFDPDMDDLPQRTLHAIVGDTDGRLLAYTCLQPAGDAHTALAADDERTYLSSPHRPQFPTERELFGAEVFTSLAALRAIPLSRIWEWACTVRNQAIKTSLTPAAMYEAFCAPILFALNRPRQIDVILGNTNLAARKVYRQLGVPGLYAPDYTVRPPHEDGYWVSSVNVQGEFWPSVMALEDVRAHPDTLRSVDQALSAPAAQLTPELREALARATPVPQQFVSDGDAARWTSAIGDEP
jgi:hypothetical protein